MTNAIFTCESKWLLSDTKENIANHMKLQTTAPVPLGFAAVGATSRFFWVISSSRGGQGMGKYHESEISCAFEGRLPSDLSVSSSSSSSSQNMLVLSSARTQACPRRMYSIPSRVLREFRISSSIRGLSSKDGPGRPKTNVPLRELVSSISTVDFPFVRLKCSLQ